MAALNFSFSFSRIVWLEDGDRFFTRSVVFNFFYFFFISFKVLRYGVARLVEALRYKPEGRGLDSRWSYWNFSLT